VSATRPSPTTPGAFLCPRCGGVLHHDQDWCLECGLAARTRIHPPPRWRLPIVATLVALALLAAGIAFALAALLDTSDRPAAATAGATAATASAPAATVPGTAMAPTTPTTVTPTTVVPSTTTPGASAPATPVPTTAAPPASTPSGPVTIPHGSLKTFTVPGTHSKLPGILTH
jgi:hypothetical protein